MEERFSRGGRKKARLLCWLCICLLAAGYFSAGSTCLAADASHQIYTPKSLRVTDVKAYLRQLSLGTASALPGSHGILLTADSSTLGKTRTVLALVDGSIPYAIERLGPATEARHLPGNETIAKRVGGLSVGTFAAPPQGPRANRVLIDVHDGDIIAIAPQDRMPAILAALTEGPQITTIDASPMPLLMEPSPPGPVSERITDGAGLVLAAAEEPNTISEAPKTPSQAPLSRTIDLGPAATAAEHQQKYTTPEVENSETELNLDLPEQLDIISLLGLVGEYLKLNFVYEPEKIQGNVNISLMLKGGQRGKVKISELYPLLESVLRFKNFAMTRKGDFVQIVPMDEVMRIDPQLKTHGGVIEQGDAIITRIFRLEHITPDSAENLLSQMKLSEDIVKIDETKTLIVTAFAFRIPRIETVLELADTPGEPKRFRYRQLQYTMAKSLKEKIKALAEQLDSVDVSISESTPELERRRGESEASYQARQRAAERAQAAAAARSPKKPESNAIYLDADERTNRILMIGQNEQLDLVDDLVDSLDVEKQDVRILKPYRIENLEAIDVREKLVELGIIAGTIGSNRNSSSQRITGEARTATTAAQPARPTPTTTTYEETEFHEGIMDEPQVIVVEATNSLLVNATPEQHLQIADILSHIDRQTEDMAIPYRIYPLENQSPEELSGVLEKLILETVQDKEGKVEQKIQKLEDDIVIVPDEKSFSLIVYASPKNQEWISSLIKTLDRPRPQVLIDVTLVEVTRNDEFTYDLNILASIPDLTQTSGLTNAIMSGVEGGDPLSLVQRLQASDRDQFIDLQSNGGSGTGFYGDQHINVLLEAMDQKGYGRVLAKPKVLVNDGEPGMIATTDTTYVYTQEGTVNASAANNVVQTAVKWDSYDAGITLEITPHINEGNLLRLDVNLQRSDFQETQKMVINGNEVIPPPNTTKSDITTVVTVPDESTIILGGMLRLNQTKGGGKVPILGDLPLIGGLFRSVKNTDKQSHLYVFVKAEVIRPSEVLEGTSDLDRISEQHRRSFEEHEAEFQMYESWPGVKARPMGPKKVLDAR
jgi:type II secretory pathway component GspD/PulD (secretin)